MRPEKIAKLELLHGNTTQRREMDELVMQVIRERGVLLGLLRAAIDSLRDSNLPPETADVLTGLLKQMNQ